MTFWDQNGINLALLAILAIGGSEESGETD